MTLVVGLKTDSCIVIGAEREEGGGIVAKRSVTKLKLITGDDWSVVVGGAGDAAVAEGAMRSLEMKLVDMKRIEGNTLTDITNEILDSVYTKYIDKDPQNDGLSLVIGASCGSELHLISTTKRVPQVQDAVAYAGIGADIAIYFLDRLHLPEEGWIYSSTVVGFTLQQAVEACRYCSGDSEVYVLQCPPNPRWRSLGDCDLHFVNSFNGQQVSNYLEKFVRKSRIRKGSAGYSDEHSPNAITIEDAERTQEIMRKAREAKKE